MLLSCPRKGWNENGRRAKSQGGNTQCANLWICRSACACAGGREGTGLILTYRKWSWEGGPQLMRSDGEGEQASTPEVLFQPKPRFPCSLAALGSDVHVAYMSLRNNSSSLFMLNRVLQLLRLHSRSLNIRTLLQRNHYASPSRRTIGKHSSKKQILICVPCKCCEDEWYNVFWVPGNWPSNAWWTLVPIIVTKSSFPPYNGFICGNP